MELYEDKGYVGFKDTKLLLELKSLKNFFFVITCIWNRNTTVSDMRNYLKKIRNFFFCPHHSKSIVF